MSFYQAMQLGAVNLKPLIKNTEDKKLKQKYIIAFVLKNILCILFCIFVVTSFSNIFGNENSVVGVVTVLALLTFRFSNLDFDVKQSAFTLLYTYGWTIFSEHINTNGKICYKLYFNNGYSYFIMP